MRQPDRRAGLTQLLQSPLVTDGAKIVFSIFSDATGENVYTANADGTGVTQVTHGGEDEAPDWGTHPLAH